MAELADCAGLLNEKCCKAVAQVLQSNTPLRELDLSHNDLGEAELKALADGLKSANCSLTHLDLSFVDLEKTGSILLEAILLGPHRQPHTLRLCGCQLKQDICNILSKAMDTASAQLKRLDIGYNYLTDAGLETFLQGISSKNCDLETMSLCACGITEKSCAKLASVLQQSSLRELDLSSNNLGDKGVKLVCTGLMSPHCRLQTLRLKDCNLYKRSCAALAPVLWTFSELKHLDLSDNDLLNTGVRLLSIGLRNPNCSLEVLRMSGCQIRGKGCALLACTLIRNPHHLEELDLSYNHPGELAKYLLYGRLEDQHCHLQKLNMEHDGQRYLKWGLKKYAVDLRFFTVVHLLEIKPREIRMLEAGNDKVGFNLFGCGSGMSNDVLSFLSEPNDLGVVITPGRKKATRAAVDELDLFKVFSFNDQWSGLETTRQVECTPHLSWGRFYWEMDWTGVGYVGVRHQRTPEESDHHFLTCVSHEYVASYKEDLKCESLSEKPDPGTKRVGVYLDWPLGTVSFYSISPQKRTLLHTVHTTFSAPVTPFFAFGPDPYDSSVTLLNH